MKSKYFSVLLFLITVALAFDIGMIWFWGRLLTMHPAQSPNTVRITAIAMPADAPPLKPELKKTPQIINTLVAIRSMLSSDKHDDIWYGITETGFALRLT